MRTEVTAEMVAGVIDQLYRGAKNQNSVSAEPNGSLTFGQSDQRLITTDAGGVPKRFFISRRHDDLRRYIGRERSLRPEFYEGLSGSLEDYGILMSEPRIPNAGMLAFASFPHVETWHPVSQAALRAVSGEKLKGAWVEAVRARLERLYQLSRGDRFRSRPFVLSQSQMCRVAQRTEFRLEWWSEVLNHASDREFRLVFFRYPCIREYRFAVTHEDYVRTWRRAVQEDWNAALRRYNLDESVDDES